MRDLDLALLYMSRPQRFAVADLFALDRAMGDVLRTTTEPMIGQIRLAWWRERLEDLDRGVAPAEPHLESARRLTSEYGLTGATLSPIADCWVPLLNPFPWTNEVIGAIEQRGAQLFGIAARLLCGRGEDGDESMIAGSLWSLVDVAKHCSDRQSADALVARARDLSARWNRGRCSAPVRSLTMLGLLARRDSQRWPNVEGEAGPSRAWLMIRHQLTGRLI
jgi:phytoene synthase